MGQALGNLRTALEDSGATVRDVLKTTVYVASSTLLGVAVLGYPGQLVEIEAIAVTPAR
jgi:enamine deaminase RidA (YjgF/YER057c/UK114 family)